VGIIFTIIKQAKQSAAFSLYCALLAALCLRVIAQSGSENLSHLLVYACSLVLSYLLFHRLLCQRGVAPAAAPRKPESPGLAKLPNRIADGLLIASAMFILCHFAYLGHVPLAAGMLSNDYFDIMRIRQSVFFEAPAVFRYPPNIILKSLLPFLLLYYYVVGRRKRFWIAAGLATFYGLALMNKMFVLIEYAPLVLYLLFNRRFYSAAATTLVPVAALALLVFVQNPHIRPALWTPQGKATASGKPLLIKALPAPQVSQAPQGPESLQAPTVQPTHQVLALPEVAAARKVALPTISPVRQFVETIYLRVFVVPGQVISVWFSSIPKQLPFANGCGYRVVAALRGCEFRFYPALVHDLENPRLVAEGVHGTMTAASFMEDYANFGIMGLVLGGILLAFVLALITRLFANDWRWALVLNFIPIAMMVELPLSTVLLTGGWASTLLLYPIFRERLRGGREYSQCT